MKSQQSDLVGMFLVLDSTDHEHYRTGYIAAAVGNCYLKVEVSEERPLPPMELYTLEELSQTCQNCAQKLANLFKTRSLTSSQAMSSSRASTMPRYCVAQKGKSISLCGMEEITTFHSSNPTCISLSLMPCARDKSRRTTRVRPLPVWRMWS